MDITKPHPQRFEVYSMLPDGKGFTIKDCKFVFKLDRYGGWRDQYGHYYNSNGQPDFQPQDAELTPSEGSLYSDDGANDYDEFEPNYDDVDGEQQEQYSSWQLRNMEKIAKNMEILSAYSLNKRLRVYFSNMPIKAPPKSVYEAYSKKVNGIMNIIFDLQQNRRNGEGHFIMEDAKKAEALIKLEGQKVIQRQVHFDVEKLNQLIMDPIKQADLVPFWGTQKTYSSNVQRNIQQKKDDIPKFKAAPVPEKTQQPKLNKQQPKKEEPTKVNLQKQQKPIPVKTEVKQKKPQTKEQVKVQKIQQPQFKLLRLNFQIFDTKTKFFIWIAQKGVNKDTDIRNINKQQKEGKTIIKMEVKTSILDKINGKQYNGKKALFTPI